MFSLNVCYYNNHKRYANSNVLYTGQYSFIYSFEVFNKCLYKKWVIFTFKILKLYHLKVK